MKLMMLRWGALLLVPLVVGCATRRVVHLDTGQGKPIIYTPPKSVEPIEIEEEAFRETMTKLVLDMSFSLREEEERPRLRLASWETEGTAPGTRGRDYGAWCSRQESPEECLTLLEDGFSFLDVQARRKMALSFAWDGVWEGVQEAVGESLNPLALKAMITSAMAAYMLLVVAPEPVTKLVAIALTTYIVAYIGLDSFGNIRNGWKRLSEDSGKAKSLEELEEAGERFGKVMGENGARVLILALTAALGGTAGLASKGPLLPGFARAVLTAETNAGLRLAAATSGGVRSMAFSDAALTVGLSADAVAATAWKKDDGSGENSGGEARPGSEGPGRWEAAHEHMEPAARQYQAQVTGAPEGYVYKVGEVKFDGFKDGVLLEAKGPGYLKFFKDGNPREWFRGTDGMLVQAERQFKAANGTPIQWHFAEREVANAVRVLFNQNGLDEIAVVFTPTYP